MVEDCSVYRTAAFIGKRWTLPILLELYRGRSKWKRFVQLKKKLPRITPKILSTRLKELEKEGMLVKKVDARKFPIKSKYCLTGSGADFINIIKGIKKWTVKWKHTHDECKDSDCRLCEL